MAISNPGGNLNSVPAPIQQTLSSNYLDLMTSTGWGQQYVPDLMEKEAEVFGPRTISGFLSQVGAEEAMTADQVIWSEQGRLHLSYKCNTSNDNTIIVQQDIDGAKGAGTGTVGISNTLTGVHHGVRVNDTIIVSNPNGVFKCVVTDVNTDTLTVKRYDAATLVTSGAAGPLLTTILVYGSEYGKGQKYNDNSGAADARTSNEPVFQTFQNKPIILKDYYEVSGSDSSRIGWVEVSTEMGQSGYLWYLKAESDTRARFNDYLEMSMLESIKGGSGNTADTLILGSDNDTGIGTQGLFDAIEDRGNITTGVTGVNAATDLAEFDAILAEFDKQGAIEEYMMFVNRSTSLAIDDM